MNKITSSTLLFKSIDRAEQVARDFSDRGLYYFDSDDGTRYGISMLHEYYTIHSYPKEPLKYSSLPEYIKKLLQFNVMDIEDFSLMKRIYVKHAYE